jgi:hypothetical protein
MWADLFGVASAETFNQSNQAHAVNYLTLVQLLIQKRIVSADEIADARIKATHFVEQEWARKREEQACENCSVRFLVLIPTHNDGIHRV